MPPDESSNVAPALGRTLQALLDQAVDEDPRVSGGVLRVDLPVHAWRGASGLADRESGVAMTPDHPFLAASVTKMITAATVLRLEEQGRVDLDAGIGRYLAPPILSGLHEYDGQSFGARITTRQLLSHTSGLPDYFTEGEPSADGVRPFVAEMRRDPDRVWRPTEVLDWTRRALRPHFAPGGGWHYSDTGFLVAGLVIEAVASRALPDVMREHVFEPHGMASTYMLYREPPRSDIAPATAYVGDVVHMHRSITADWGGGGLVTTVDDLSQFLHAIEDRRILAGGQSSGMMGFIATGEPHVEYGLGIWRIVLERMGMPGCGEIWGHSGFLKSFAFCWPRFFSLCGTLNQSQAAGDLSSVRPVTPLVRRVIEALRQHVVHRRS